MPKKGPATTTTTTTKPAIIKALIEMLLECETPFGTGEERCQQLLVQHFGGRDGDPSYLGLEEVEQNVLEAILGRRVARWDDLKPEERAAEHLAQRFVRHMLGLDNLRLTELGVKIPKAPKPTKPAATGKPKKASKKSAPKKATKPAATGKTKGGKKAAPPPKQVIHTGEPPKRGRPRKGSAPATAAPRTTQASLPDIEPPESTAPEAPGANDPQYAEALARLQALGKNVTDDYAVDEIYEIPELSFDRAEAIFEAMKAKGDWPLVLVPEAPKRGRGRPAAGTGVDDPLYGSAVGLMAGLAARGTTTTIGELAKQLGVGDARASKIVKAMKERGDWPKPAARPEAKPRQFGRAGYGRLAVPPEFKKALGEAVNGEPGDEPDDDDLEDELDEVAGRGNATDRADARGGAR